MDPLNVVGPGIEVVKGLCAPLARRINYLKNFKDIMDNLKRKEVELTAKERDINMALERAEQQKKPTEEVRVWMEHVLTIKNQVSNIERELQENQRCFHNCCSRLKLRKLVFKVTEEVLELLATSKFRNGFLVDQSPDRALVLPSLLLVGKSTAEKTLDVIWNSLMDPEIGMIGIHGMGGVGKTTIMKNINNRLAATSHFDKIIWATVSRDLNLKRLQDDIAHQLKLDLSECLGEVNRAAGLQKTLKKAHKFLLILDDVWDKIPLDKVGIPEPNKENNNCKIVLTTRSLRVCHFMETQKNIRVELLSEVEAWDLFVSKVGDQILMISGIQPVARDVLHECGRLPLAIITVGCAMREEGDIRVWRSALNELKNSPTEIQGMEDEVFKPLKFSYTHLRNDTLQNCFLYCSLFPEDYEINSNVLIEYWMAEGLIAEVGDRVANIDKGFMILKELKDANMLQDGPVTTSASIVMHDLIRDLAITIGREELGFLVKAGIGLEESPMEGEWTRARRISLIRNKIEALREQPVCPNLSTLLLQENPLRQNIPRSFFSQMHALQVLNLSDSQISLLPSSLSNLANLRALFLTNCKDLKTLPSIANLKELRVLNLSGTFIRELPQGMEGLVNLRSLDLSGMSELKNIKVGMIQKLSLLEDLRADRSPFLWEDSADLDTRIKEIGCLKHLSTLTLVLQSIVDLNKVVNCIQWEVLKGYVQISVRHSFDSMVTDENNSVGIYKVDMSNGDTLLLPTNTQVLVIIKCDIPPLSRFRNLRLPKKCMLSSCNLMDCLVKGDEMEENTLTHLEDLKLRDIKNLKVLWKGVVSSGSFENLRIFLIFSCPDLKNLFSFKLLVHLKNIEYIHVKNCKLMEEIVIPDGEGWEDDATTTTIVLPRLRALLLQSLPKLHTIISGKTLACDSLMYFEVKECGEVKKLPFRVDGLSNLEEINVEREWWEALEWDDANTKTLLQPRFTASGLPESMTIQRIREAYGDGYSLENFFDIWD